MFKKPSQRFFKATSFLKYAGFYNLAWGVYILNRPDSFYGSMNHSYESVPWIMYPFGLAVLGFGLLYLWAAVNPIQRWSAVLIGLVSKTLGPLLAYPFLLGKDPHWESYMLHVIFNDLIWIIPLSLILYNSFKAWQNTETPDFPPFPQILKKFSDQEQHSLSDMNREQALILVFLRHFGCTFCRESLENFKLRKELFTQKNLKLVFIHMGDEMEAQTYFEKYGLEDESRISDPHCELYRTFSLERAKFGQVFGLSSWWRGFWVGIVEGKGIGKLVGDGFRMPGVFVIHKDRILHSQIQKKAASRPDYEQIAACEIN